MTIRTAAGLAALAACLAPAVFSSGTTAWEMNSYADFLRGRFDGISLSREGRLSLAPKVDTVFTSDQPVIWSVAEGTDGSLYAATGHRGRVYRIDRSGKSSLLWTADQPEVFAITVGRDGAVYAGTSPDGKVYRIASGKAEEYFAPKARYIWSLAASTDGSLYVGTGDQGKIYRVTGPGQGELYYDTGQSHITGLAIDNQGRLLAGTEPNGLLYRISAKDKAFVLYDAALPEIRAIVPMPDGSVYAAALGGSIAKRAQAANQAGGNSGAAGSVPTVTTSITVEAQAQPGEIKPPDPTKPVTSAITTAPTPAATTSYTAPTDTSGADKSAVYRINPDNTVETLWSSKEENVYDILALERQVLFSTDENGRIYGLAPDRRVTLVTQTNEGETTRLLPADHSVLAATGNMGRIFRLGEQPGPSGSYESPVHDSGTASRWGSIAWRADMPSGATLDFRTRSGNSARPDRTWSDWSEPLSNASGSPVTSPNARYIQWKAEMHGTGGATPLLNSVTVAYLPQNSPPVVHSINVVTTAVPATAAKAVNSGASSAYSVTVSDSPDTGAPAAAGTPTQTLMRASTQQITVVWQADDPDNDRLVYAVYFRSEDASQWMLLKSGLHDNSITFDGDILADGKYYFRVVASDREVNPPPSAREAQMTSAPVMIDNTPPIVTIGPVRYTNGAAHVEFEAVDNASPLRHCEYSLDAAGWVPVEAADGVIDSLREKFVLDLPGLAPGEHLLVLRVADSANNSGLAKVVLK
jgi:hypothetical protein